jgi:hypothetical protein
MKTIPFSLDRYIPGKTKVVTRDGRDVRILCTDRNNDAYPIVTLLNNEVFGSYTRKGGWSQSCLGHPNDLLIQLEPTLRPWKPEEVPVGAMVRNIGTKSRYLITEWCCAYPTTITVSGCKYSFDVMLRSYEHSLDHGKTWHPCGVEE